MRWTAGENMENRIIAVRTVGVAAATMLIAVFVHVYGVMQANWLQYGLRTSLVSLPSPTVFFHRYSFLGYVLPLAAFLSILMRKNAQEHADAFLWLVGIVALAWLFASILSWQLPLYYPVAVIR